MLSLPPAVRIFVCAEPADMRRSFDGLSRIVHEFLGGDPLSGHLLVFVNKRADHMKLLHWDRDGFVIWYKRLEQGTFRVSQEGEVTSADLMLLLEGFDVSGAKRAKRYKRP